MTERLNTIFKHIPKCTVFADVGCDHGYIAKAVLKSSLAEKVIISDISANCLKKAEVLLEQEISNGTAKSVVCSGLDLIEFCDVALIAGMGGEEIIGILNSAPFLPKQLILQPMKNVDKVRVKVNQLGYKIQKDFLFKAGGKFYDLLVLTKGEDAITDEEIEFGRTNLKEKSSAFIEWLNLKIEKLIEYENRVLDKELKSKMLKEIERLKKYV